TKALSSTFCLRKTSGRIIKLWSSTLWIPKWMLFVVFLKDIPYRQLFFQKNPFFLDPYSKNILTMPLFRLAPIFSISREGKRQIKTMQVANGLPKVGNFDLFHELGIKKSYKLRWKIKLK